MRRDGRRPLGVAAEGRTPPRPARVRTSRRCSSPTATSTSTSKRKPFTRAGNTTSQTIVRSAGTGRGQGRYFGNIKILANAHGAEASLRDDVLLLSEGAHIDSVPALEIAANDVKAFHGATVGAISEEELFYAQSRGIARADAERMIALGFFESAVARFPLEGLRDEIRAALERKIVSAGEVPA